MLPLPFSHEGKDLLAALASPVAIGKYSQQEYFLHRSPICQVRRIPRCGQCRSRPVDLKSGLSDGGMMTSSSDGEPSVHREAKARCPPG
jgi:hypothetical protein